MKLCLDSLKNDSNVQSNIFNFTRDETRMKGRVRPEGREFYERETRGAGVASLFSDLQLNGNQANERIPRGKRKKESPKKFSAINQKLIKELEIKTAEKKRALDEAAAARPLWKSSIFTKVQPRVETRWTEPPGAAGRSQSVVPGERRSSGDDPRPSSSGTMARTPQPPRTRTDFVRRNIHSASSAGMRRSSSVPSLKNINDSTSRNSLLKGHKAGVIPNYLKQRKLAWDAQKEKEAEIEKEKRIGAPPGHVLLSEEERERTMEMLRNTENELTRKLNTLPVRNDTMFLRKRKSELLQQLEEVEEALTIFSRPKVFVKQTE